MDPTVAKQFLISKVVGEAESEHIPLSEIETKMLYFTEAILRCQTSTRSMTNSNVIMTATNMRRRLLDC
jgi:hypothetical protein